MIFIAFMIDQFAFDGCKKRFGHRIVPAIPLAGHALDKFMVIELFAKIVARILHATIRMKDKSLQPTTIRENRSMITVKYIQPVRVARYVISDTQTLSAA